MYITIIQIYIYDNQNENLENLEKIKIIYLNFKILIFSFVNKYLLHYC